MRVTMVLTHNCNLACSYCYAGEKSGRQMSMETGWKSLALAFAGPEDEAVQVAFFGGEPMLAFERMVALTRLAAKWGRRRGRKVVFTITTNGTLLGETRLRFLQHYGFYVGVSLDGTPEAHDRHRPFASGRGSAELIWQNLARAAGVLDHLSVVMVLSPDTVGCALEAAHRLRDIGLYRLELSPDLDAVWGEEDRVAAGLLYRDLARLYLETRATDAPLYVHPFVEEMARAGADRPGTGETFCAMGVEEVAVAPSGHIYPCVRLVGADRRPELRIGEAGAGISSEKVQQVRELAQERLRACGDAPGHCMCVPLMPGDGSRQVEQMLYFERLVEQALAEARAQHEAKPAGATAGG
jgi:uncharacterized protein